MDYISIKGAIDGVGYIRTALSTLLNEKNEMTVRERVMDILSRVDNIQSALFEARESLFEIQKERDDLQRQIREFENWKDTEEKYALQKTPGGAWLYESIGEPKHFVCPSCFAQKRVLPLQRSTDNLSRCPSCRVDYRIRLPRGDS